MRLFHPDDIEKYANNVKKIGQSYNLSIKTKLFCEIVLRLFDIECALLRIADALEKEDA